MASPLKIGKMLSCAFFKRHITKTTVNKRKGLIAVDVSNAVDVNQLANCKVLDNVEVECILKSDEPSFRHGVIHPVSLDTPLDEIKEMMVINDNGNGNIVVSAIERLKRKVGLEWEPCQSLKLTFTGSVLPESVKIGYSFYRISPYVQAPLQCFKCQRMGHTAKSCKSRARCMLCGEDHSKAECNVPDATGYHCANCGGNHRANDPKCGYYRQAREVEVVRSTENVNYFQAKKIVYANKKNDPSVAGVRPGNLSYAQMASPGSPATNVITVSDNNSVEPAPSTSNADRLADESPQKSLLFSKDDLKDALKSCLLDILSEILPNQLKEQTNLQSVISSKVDSHFKKRKSIDRSSSSSSSSSVSSESSSSDNDMQEAQNAKSPDDLNASYILVNKKKNKTKNDGKRQKNN